MKKTLRIFANDTRHFWPEICLTLAITAIYALTISSTWPGFPHHLISQRDAGYLGSSIVIVLMLVWYLVAARIVVEDPLAGDKQLWISRPVGWQALLSAKLLFLAVFLLVPLSLANAYILHQAGFNPLHFLPSLGDRVLDTYLDLLPVLALAALSPTLKRLLFYVIAFVALVYVSTLANSLIHSRPEIYIDASGFDWLRAILSWTFQAGCAVVVFIQYSRRRTSLSFIVLVVALLLFVGLDTANNHRSPLREFPLLAAQEQPPVKITFNPDPKLQEVHPILADDDKVDIRVPVILSQIAPGHIVLVDGTSTTVEAAGVAPVTLPWTGYSTMTNQDYVAIDVPGDFIRRAAGKPLTFHVTYAISELEPVSTTTLITGGQTLNVPGDGHCYQYSGADDAVCLYARQYNRYNRVSWIYHQQCGISSSGDVSHEVWSNSFMPIRDSASNFSPIKAMDRVFPIHARQVDSDLYFCPNSPLTFTSFRTVRRRRMQITLPPIDPQLYNPFSRHDERY